MADWLGKIVGKVKIEKLIARGGMAEVYLGTHLTLNRPVALKALLGYLEDQKDTQQRFQREAHTVAGLRHPNIVQILDFDVFDGQPYLVMEYLPGPSLAAYLKSLQDRGLRLPAPMIARLLSLLASALDYAHAQGVVHRDVKPANILLHSKLGQISLDMPLPEDVEPVLTDFGLSRLLNSQVKTASGLIAGTPAYMSPEQARGDPVDSRSDVYSLGIVLYEMLAGDVPFGAEETLAVLHKHINEPPPRIPDLSPNQQAIVDRVLKKNPDLRYHTPGQMARDFLSTVGATLPGAPDFLDASIKLPPHKRRKVPVNRTPFWIALAGSMTLLLAAGIWWFGVLGTKRQVTGLGDNLTATATGQPAGIFPSLEAPGPTAAPEEQPVGVLTFSDLGAAALNQVILDVSAVQPPAAGQRYEAWLVADEIRRSIGTLAVDQAGAGQLTFIDPQSRNLVGSFDTLEITLEPDPDDSPNPSDDVVYSSVFPPDALRHVRHLLFSMADTPGQIGLVHGLVNASQEANDAAHAMLAANTSGDTAGIRRQAEALYNIIVGNQDPGYGDLNGDSQVSDPGDGYGLLLNGDHSGYIEGVNAHASYAAGTGDTNANVQMHAMHVEICMQNLEGWTTQLRDLARQIAAGETGAGTQDAIHQAVSLADRVLNGVDVNGNEQIQPIPGEGGTKAAYQHAYYMAVMSVYPGAHTMPPVAPPMDALTPVVDYVEP